MREGSRPIIIMLVEDDDGHARLLEKNLRRGGVSNRLVRVADGQEAIDYLTQRDGSSGETDRLLPSIILLDIRMPRVDGFEVLEFLKKHAGLMRIPVIMLTSTDNRVEINRAYQMGANGYIVKPVSVQAFIDRIVRLGMFIEVMELPENMVSDYPAAANA